MKWFWVEVFSLSWQRLRAIIRQRITLLSLVSIIELALFQLAVTALLSYWQCQIDRILRCQLNFILCSKI